MTHERNSKSTFWAFTRKLAVTAGIAASVSFSNLSTALAADQVVVATYGGAFLKALENVYFKDFTAATGIAVVTVEANEGRFVAMGKSGSSEWDTTDAAGFSVIEWSKNGVLQKLPADVPRSSLVNEAYRDYAGYVYGQSYVLVYDSSVVKKAPKSWSDVWNVADFPGKRGWPSDPYGAMEAALMADGATQANMYPLDFNRAFAKLDKLRPEMTIYTSYAASIQGLQAGSVSMALVPNGRAYALIKQDPRFKIMWEQNIYMPSAFPLTTGAPNTAGAAKLFTFMADPMRQAKFAELIGYAPTVPAAFTMLKPEVASQLPGTPEHMKQALVVDEVALSNQNTALLDAYSNWIAK